ncbi:hypothetical protein HanPI659440_Chr09g0319361 [Helianthus annuus]|nr:hypothetical protein HanPI659440_Chr09g0319361 [Helianthus annuus]
MIQNSNGSISAIPNCLHSLVGTTRTIQVDTSTYYHHGAFESFNCKRVLPDETNCQSVGSTTPTPMTRKGKGVMTIPTPVKLKETIRKYIPTYEGSDSDGSVGSAPGESPTYEGSYSDGSVGSAPGERQRVRIIKRTSRREFTGERRALKFFRFSSRKVMIKHKYLNRTLKRTLPHLIFCLKTM